VRSEIVFRDGRRVNLFLGVPPELYAELESLRSPKLDPALFCGKCSGGLYIQHGRKDRDQLFGYHHVAGGCTETYVIAAARMSDEHKRMAEYHVAAAKAEGFNADMEVVTTGRTRVDVVVDGRIGIEVQRSALTARAAMDRTARSVGAGLETVAWCGIANPAWTGRVPGYQWLDVDRVLREMPRARSVRSRGLVTFRPERSPYGRWEPKLEAVTVLVDDAVARMAAGTIRPVVHGGYVRLVNDDGMRLYEEMTGRPLPAYDPGKPPVRMLASAPEVPCERPRAAAPVLFPVPPRKQGACNCCGQQPALLYPAGWRCDSHRPGGGSLWSGDACTRTCRTTRACSGPKPTGVPDGC
jgi:hypothetical protein